MAVIGMAVCDVVCRRAASGCGRSLFTRGMPCGRRVCVCVRGAVRDSRGAVLFRAGEGSVARGKQSTTTATTQTTLPPMKMKETTPSGGTGEKKTTVAITATTATTAMWTTKTRTRTARTNDKGKRLTSTPTLGGFIIFKTTTDPRLRPVDGARAKARPGEQASGRKGARNKRRRDNRRRAQACPGEKAPGRKCVIAPGRTGENAPGRKRRRAKRRPSVKAPGRTLHAPKPGRKGDGRNAPWAKMRLAKMPRGSKAPRGKYAR